MNNTEYPKEDPFASMPEVPFHRSPIDYDNITVYDGAFQTIPSGARVEVWRVKGAEGIYIVMRRPLPDGRQRVIKFLLTNDAAEALYGLIQATIFTTPNATNPAAGSK